MESNNRGSLPPAPPPDERYHFTSVVRHHRYGLPRGALFGISAGLLAVIAVGLALWSRVDPSSASRRPAEASAVTAPQASPAETPPEPAAAPAVADAIPEAAATPTTLARLRRRTTSRR